MVSWFKLSMSCGTAVSGAPPTSAEVYGRQRGCGGAGGGAGVGAGAGAGAATGGGSALGAGAGASAVGGGGVMIGVSSERDTTTPTTNAVTTARIAAAAAIASRVRRFLSASEGSNTGAGCGATTGSGCVAIALHSLTRRAIEPASSVRSRAIAVSIRSQRFFTASRQSEALRSRTCSLVPCMRRARFSASRRILLASRHLSATYGSPSPSAFRASSARSRDFSRTRAYSFSSALWKRGRAMAPRLLPRIASASFSTRARSAQGAGVTTGRATTGGTGVGRSDASGESDGVTVRTVRPCRESSMKSRFRRVSASRSFVFVSASGASVGRRSLSSFDDRSPSRSISVLRRSTSTSWMPFSPSACARLRRSSALLRTRQQ